MFNLICGQMSLFTLKQTPYALILFLSLINDHWPHKEPQITQKWKCLPIGCNKNFLGIYFCVKMWGSRPAINNIIIFMINLY